MDVRSNRAAAHSFGLSERLLQFVKFCIFGGTGVVVDMSVLYSKAAHGNIHVAINLVQPGSIKHLAGPFLGRDYTRRNAR